ncbi:MAG: hypothetical protein GH144_07905 [Clostridia bacterium]|nr:hypothetical protein [Clostridia bacterium]
MTPLVKEDRKKGSESQGLSPYLIKKALVDKDKRCAGCYKMYGPMRLSRVRQKKGPLPEDGYCLLCHNCILKRQEKRKQEKKRLWRRKAARRKLTRGGFWNRTRSKILERDNYTCLWCGTKEKEKLGLGSLIPLSRGGKLEFDNYVTTCQHCRPSKGNKLPLEFIAEPIFIDEYLHEELDERLRLKSDPGKNTSIRFGLLAEISEFLDKLTNNNSIPSKLRTKSERLNIKLLS